ncbi:MAG TPA: class I SAM-dependent methyltransferase [Burkholderiales bacterium]|nr:class I SAM-dependent methyltransferase [Burkholderiales bacterium]
MRTKGVKAFLRRVPVLPALRQMALALPRDCGLRLTLWIRALSWFVRDYSSLAREARDPAHSPTLRFLSPRLGDKRSITPVEPVYFFQNTWAARKIFTIGVAHHVDVGSSAMALGVIAQHVPVTMVDIRPILLEVQGLRFKEGSILALPFEDGSLDSISSLCVIEHIGLGRYGDAINAYGTESALRELARVLKPGGHLLVSAPVDEECRVYFNAHRAFTRDYLLQLFHQFTIEEERYQYGMSMHERYDPAKGFGTGMFHLRKAPR